MYPIAIIKNVTYDEVSEILGEAFLKEITEKVVPSVSDLELINNLRTLLKNALITTYTYQPLVGILSETNPAGITIYYSYDTAGRLTNKYRLNQTIGEIEQIESYEYEY